MPKVPIVGPGLALGGIHGWHILLQKEDVPGSEPRKPQGPFQKNHNWLWARVLSPGKHGDLFLLGQREWSRLENKEAGVGLILDSIGFHPNTPWPQRDLTQVT